mgnify:CR=1 FL=1
MKIPEKIKVLYKEYIVEETANLHDESRRSVRTDSIYSIGLKENHPHYKSRNL